MAQKPYPDPAVSLLTIPAAAKHIDASPDTVRRMIARGDLPAYRYGPKLVRIDPADLVKLRRPVTPTAAYRDALDGGGAA